jgi:ankyrin repeat protein
MRFRALTRLSIAAVLAGVAGTTVASTALIEAVKNGDRDAALALVADEGEVTSAEPDGTTALHWAVRQDDLELATRLLDAGADPSAANRYGVTPLYLAAENGSARMLAALLEAGANVGEVGREGETVLMTAARTGNVEAAEVLLEAGARVDARESWHGQTALMWAAAQGHPAMIERLLAAGADIDARSNVEEWERQMTAEPREKWLPPGGMTPLLFAAREGCTACVPVLAMAGADIDATTADGLSGPVLALINGHYDTAAALVDVGTNPNLLDYAGRGALYAAIDFNTMPSSNRPAPEVLENEHTALEVAVMLLERGADPNAALDRISPYRAKLDRGNDTVLGRGTTPLLRAAKAADLPAMRVLLEHGADPAAMTNRGVNALMLAAGLGTAEEDTTGRYKTEAQAIEAIDVMLERGLDINAVDSRGRTALHGAALLGHDEVVQALVERGAALDMKDSEGFTPLDTALGLAGGWGFARNVGVVQESTAALLRKLAEQQPSAARDLD